MSKAIRLLMKIAELDSNQGGVTVAELVKATGLSRPTVYRFLSELGAHGMVNPVPKRSAWQLGGSVVALAAMSGTWSTIRRRARREMESFVVTAGVTVSLGVRDRFEVVYIDKADSPDQMSISWQVGQRHPLSTTSLGKCLVAFDSNEELAADVAAFGLPGRTSKSIISQDVWMSEIEEVRRRGVAFDRQECERGAQCIAAPIMDQAGYGIAAVSLTTLTTSGSDQGNIERFVDDIKSLAERISRFSYVGVSD